MAILDIYTENPDISWVIKKNPATQKESGVPFERTLRKGKLLAWYKNDNEFRILFQEGNGVSSFYKFLNNNYLDQSSYNCPYVYCALINEMLSATTKQEHEKDIICNNSISISAMLITLSNVANNFIKYFSDKVNIEMTLLGKKSYSVKFSGNISLYYLINLVQVFCLIQSMEDKNIYIDMNEGALIKYAQALKNIQSPYFIVYLFLSRCVPDLDSFKKVKSILEQEGWNLNYGNTQKQRFDNIKKAIVKGHTLHDIGCGELYYSRYFAKDYEQVYSWDTDAVIQERNEKFIAKKGLHNIKLMNSFNVDNISKINSGSDLLITEMLEHISKNEAKEILTNLKNKDFRKLIITMPNSDFNQFYKLNGEFRHDDHKWEPTYQETVDFIKEIFNNSENEIEIKPIGDGINGTHISTLIIVTKFFVTSNHQLQL